MGSIYNNVNGKSSASRPKFLIQYHPSLHKLFARSPLHHPGIDAGGLLFVELTIVGAGI